MASSSSVHAAQITIGSQVYVSEQSINPTEIVNVTIYNPGGGGSIFYSGAVYAGLNQLLVGQTTSGGTVMNGFCIDPFHFSSTSPVLYNVVNLSAAPKNFNGVSDSMGAQSALYIERLWGTFYSPTMSATTAAGLQIAIWEIVGGSYFRVNSLNDYGAANMVNLVENANYSGLTADLVGLSSTSQRGQDYVVQNEGGSKDNGVPDGGFTVALLALAFGASVSLRKVLA